MGDKQVLLLLSLVCDSPGETLHPMSCAQAVMLACLSPTKEHCEESLNTLHFASLALHVHSQPVIILSPQDKILMELR